MRFTCTLKLREPKKHSVRYDSSDSDAVVSSLYVSKSAFSLDDRIKNNYPNTLYLTLDNGDSK